jgi:hypothetical protein
MPHATNRRCWCGVVKLILVLYFIGHLNRIDEVLNYLLN